MEVCVENQDTGLNDLVIRSKTKYTWGLWVSWDEKGAALVGHCHCPSFTSKLAPDTAHSTQEPVRNNKATRT